MIPSQMFLVHYEAIGYFILGVHRIVIFAEAEYSAECSLPKPNILPNIRHAE